MTKTYDASAVEAKWQKQWQDAGLFDTDLKKAKKPFYNLVMFPYPSGDKLHVGHWYNFAPADSYGRFKRMQGHDVFEPMGFDAFGLPAENYAVKTGIHPDTSTRKNVETMIQQLKRIGCMYDWSRSVNTSAPEYYRWTQWLFLQMLQHGLAYRREAPVNFCPQCQTVLANEQAQDGTCERCGTQVIQKQLTQWFWKITQYADRLLENLEQLDWPEKTKLMQKNWIGRSEGAEVVFDVEGSKHAITVFTTRVDTLFSAAFVVLAPEHPLVEQITVEKRRGEVERYKVEAQKKTELQRTDLAKEKTGVFTGAYAINPANGERIPVWVGDFVIAHYGYGAVFGDAHDERDFAFAGRYGIPMRTTIRPVGGEDPKVTALEKCFTDDGILVDSGQFTGLTSAEARKRIASWLEDEEKGRCVVQYRLRDWLVSRQRYWGAPIPVVYDPEGNPHPVPEKHLPWLLPTDVEFKPTGKSPLALSKEFVARTEKLFGKGWTPEFDTMDTFVCSSFYELRYLAGGDAKRLVDPTIERHWLPVSMYIGGPEHACMHLIYARFVTMALKDFGFISHEEPFKKLVHQGLITNKGAKMSKSKGNVVSPDSFVSKHGSDVFRMYLMFMGPFTQGGDWSETGIKGIDRFVQRIARLSSENMNKKIDQISQHLTAKIHATIKKCTEDIERLHFNTAISALMELLSAYEEQQSVTAGDVQIFAKLITPLAPHLAEEMWASAGGKGFVIEQAWPHYDPAQLKTESVTIAVQVNGKLRAQIVVPAQASEEQVLADARKDENVRRHLEGKEIRKVIYVAGRLLNIVA